MSLTDPDKKMSKSDETNKGCIYLLDPLNVARKKVMSAVTDSLANVHYDPENQPGIANLMQIMSSLSNDRPFGDIEQEFKGKGYGDFKKAVAEVVCNKLEEIQTRYNEITNSNLIEKTLNEGANKARAIASKKLDLVQKKLGMEIVLK